MGAHILVVDDDELLRRSLAFNLEQSGFEVKTAASAENAIAMAAQNTPDVILLDIMLPGMDGLEALRYFRDKAAIPVIFLTARRRELDQVLGLELGADDYITKPFNADVVVARIHTVLRRLRTVEHPLRTHAFTVGQLTIDPAARTVVEGERPVELTPKEFDLLYSLAVEPNRVLTIDELLARVWGAEYNGEPQIVYVHIRWLRQKIEKDPQKPEIIVTIRGVGYKLMAAEPTP